jgi:hypothetical protein
MQTRTLTKTMLSTSTTLSLLPTTMEKQRSGKVP